jgi:60 kDa SS-A/Ro ribonucleoprotein
MSKYSDLVTNRHSTPQTQQAEPEQQRNNAGGFTFVLEPFDQLKRFLILGSDSGTFYVSPRKLTLENMGVVKACLNLDPVRTLEVISAVSKGGRAPKNDTAIFATALAIAHPNVNTAQAMDLVSATCRIGTHIFMLCDIVKAIGSSGRKVRRAISSWYERRSGDQLAYQAAKYQSREGWTHLDVMRISHPHLKAPLQRGVADWLRKRESEFPRPELLGVVDSIKANKPTTTQLVTLINKVPALSWEMLPSESLTNPEIWQALLNNGLPLNALIRNLGRLSSIGLTKPMSEAAKQVTAALTNAEALKRARIHPISLLKALKVYNTGGGVLGKLTWTQNSDISSALEAAFYLAFDSIEPTNKNTLLGIDVSGSMGAPVFNGRPGHQRSVFGHAYEHALSCAEGAAVMAMATFRTEPQAYAMGFADSFRDLGFTRLSTFNEAMAKTRNQNFGRTDCALPMVWALENKINVETFVVYTDNETYHGAIHPHQALEKYRNKMGIAAKLVVVGMTTTKFSIANPSDAGMMDCVGFDTATPAAIASFAR